MLFTRAFNANTRSSPISIVKRESCSSGLPAVADLRLFTRDCLWVVAFSRDVSLAKSVRLEPLKYEFGSSHTPLIGLGITRRLNADSLDPMPEWPSTPVRAFYGRTTFPNLKMH